MGGLLILISHAENLLSSKIISETYTPLGELELFPELLNLI